METGKFFEVRRIPRLHSSTKLAVVDCCFAAIGHARGGNMEAAE